MTNTTDSSEQQQTPGHTQAMDVKPGNVVILITSDGPAAFIKTERIGKEYIHHYAVQIFPRVMTELGMVYLDPEDEVFDTMLSAGFELGDGIAGTPPSAGHAFENASGHFIKVNDDPKSQKMFGFINISTAIVMRRQERGVNAVYTDWCAVCSEDGASITLDHVLERFENKF